MPDLPTIHPLFVHFPLALLLSALALQVVAQVRGKPEWAGHARACLYLGTLGALAAVGTGLHEAGTLGHDSPGHGLVHAHRNMMVVATLFAVGTSVAALRSRAGGAGRDRAVLVGLLLTAGPLVIGGDRGGQMVFRYGVGVANEPLPSAGHGAHDHGAPPSASVGEPAPEPHDHGAHGHDTESETLPEPDPAPVAPPAATPVGDSHAGHDHAH